MIQVIHRALGVLEHLSRQGERPCALGAIAHATGLNVATCSRILTTLMNKDYVEQEGRRKGYRLGPMAYGLTARGPYRKDLVACAEPLVRQLAETTGETVIVAIVQHNTRYTVCRTEGTHDVQVRTDAVLGDDPYPFATGRLLLAHLPPDERDAFVARSGLPTADVWPEAHTRQGLLAELTSIRAKSAVITSRQGQVVALARPLRDGDRVVAALGLYLPASRFDRTHKDTVLKAMKTTADAISARLTELHTPSNP